MTLLPIRSERIILRRFKLADIPDLLEFTAQPSVIKHHRKVEIGFGLGIAQRGRGYATEAARALINTCFAELDLQRVQAIASSGNPDSIQVPTDQLLQYLPK